MPKLAEWIAGWSATLRIMIFERETYRFLRDYEFAAADFIEVEAPDAEAS